jgi:tetratricopeptide (TPR) repeat protein
MKSSIPPLRIATRRFLGVAVSLLITSIVGLYIATNCSAKTQGRKVVIRVGQYRMISGEETYRPLETLIPMALTYKLRVEAPALGWTVFYSFGQQSEGSIQPAPLGQGNAEPEKTFQKGTKLAETPLDISISGTFLEVEGKIRLYHQIRAAGQEDILASKSMTFNADEGLTELSDMVDQVGSAIRAFLAPATSAFKKSRLLVMCFQQVDSGKKSKSSATSGKDLSWLGLEISRQIAVNLRKMDRLVLIPEEGGVPGCDENRVLLLKRHNPDIVVAGEFFANEDGQLNAAARIIEVSEDRSIGPITVSGDPKDYFTLSTELSESVRQVLSEAMDENGKLIIQGSFEGDVSAEEYYARGLLYLADGHEAIALLMFSKSLEKNHEQPRIYLELAKIYQHRGDLRHATRSALTALEQNPDSEEGHFLLGDLYFKSGELEKAYDVYSRWLTRHDSSRALIRRGNIRFFQEKFDEAVEDYRQALKIDPENPEALSAIGSVYLSRRQYAEAAASFQKALSRKDLPAARQGLANAYTKTGIQFIEQEKYDRSIEFLKQSIDIYPTSESYGRLAQALFKTDRVDEAYEAVLASVRLGKNKAWPHAGLGRILYEKKDYQRAIEELLLAIEIEPKHGFANLYLGKSYHALEQNKLAIRHLKTSFDICFDRSDYRLAAEAMDTASKIDPHNAMYAGLAGESYRMMNQLNKAIDRLEKAARLDPELNWAHGLLGICYLQIEAYDKAIRELEITVETDPKLSWAHEQLGVAYHLIGEEDKAIESMLASLKLDPDQPWAHYYLVEIYLEKKKNSEKALEHAMKGIEAASKQPDLQALVQFRSAVPEILITLGRYDDAIQAADGVLKIVEKDSIRLNMMFVVATAKILKGQQVAAKPTIADLLESYSKVSANFKNIWVYNGILSYVDQCDWVDQDSKEMIEAMTQLLDGKISQGAFLQQFRLWYLPSSGRKAA